MPTLRLRHRSLRLCDLCSRLFCSGVVILGGNSYEFLPDDNELIVPYQNLLYIARDAWRNANLVRAKIGVVGGLLKATVRPVTNEKRDQCHHQDGGTYDQADPNFGIRQSRGLFLLVFLRLMLVFFIFVGVVIIRLLTLVRSLGRTVFFLFSHSNPRLPSNAMPRRYWQEALPHRPSR